MDRPRNLASRRLPADRIGHDQRRYPSAARAYLAEARPSRLRSRSARTYWSLKALAYARSITVCFCPFLASLIHRLAPASADDHRRWPSRIIGRLLRTCPRRLEWLRLKNLFFELPPRVTRHGLPGAATKTDLLPFRYHRVIDVVALCRRSGIVLLVVLEKLLVLKKLIVLRLRGLALTAPARVGCPGCRPRTLSRLLRAELRRRLVAAAEDFDVIPGRPGGLQCPH